MASSKWLVYLCKRKLLSKTNANSRVLLMAWQLGIELKAFYCHFPTLSSLRRCFNRFSCTVSARSGSAVPVLVVAASEMQRCMKWLQATAGLTNNAAEKTNWQTNTQHIRAEILGPFFKSQQNTTHTLYNVHIKYNHSNHMCLLKIGKLKGKGGTDVNKHLDTSII